MCGIFAIINKSNKIDPSILKKGISILSHRGPDSEGTLIDGNIGLAHRRLSVFDISHNGDQPMSRNGCSIIFNGAIYNFPKIRKELEQKGYVFQSNTDTEVILASYQEYGEKCVNHFNGQWAFVLYDSNNKIIFCSRDRYGIKPLYYYKDDYGIYFASEIKAFTCLPSWRGRINHSRAIEFLAYQMHDHTTETLFEGVNHLEGGHNLVYEVKKGSSTISSYYYIDDITTINIDYHTAQAEVDRLLSKSIQYRLRSDVPLGLALSGGLDSSVITERVASISDYPINSYSIIYQENGINEAPFLDSLPQAILQYNHRYSPNPDNMMTILDKVLWHQEEPFNGMSVIAQYLLMSYVKEHGIKVLLDGQGADEIFAGYEKFYLFQLRKVIRRNPIVGIYHLFQLRNRFPTFRLRERMKAYRGSNERNLPSWIKNQKSGSLFTRPKESSILDISKNLFTGPGLGALLRYEDKNAMAYGIESRLPYLDHELVAFVLSLPDEFKVTSSRTKIILRDISKTRLPPKIVNRKDKLGFVTPERRWIEENKGYFVRALNEMKVELSDYVDVGKVKRENNPALLWRVFIFGKWLRQWG